MNRFISKVLNRLMNTGDEIAPRKRVKPRLYKPASSYGWRGSPKSFTRCGSVPAPTIDQVRKLERTYLTKLLVKGGLMYFKSDGTLFSYESAMARRRETMEAMLETV